MIPQPGQPGDSTWNATPIEKRNDQRKAALARKQAALEKASGQKIFLMSGVSGEGLKEVLHALARAVEKARNKTRPKKQTAESWAP